MGAPSSNSLHADVCVLGAGIVGLAHAHEARRRGCSVVVLDRDQRAVGASVRNFGHLFFTSVADGPAFDCAMRSRERWLELGRRAGIFMEDAGSVIVARAQDELALLEAVAAKPERGARMLTAAQVGELAPIPTDTLVGGFHGTRDLRADPRGAVAGLARLLEDDPQARIVWRTHVHDVEPGVVHGRELTVHAPTIIVCPGPDYRSLPPSLHPGLEPLTLCQLQMLLVAPPHARTYRAALATGLSLIRYPAFAQLEAAAALRARLEREQGELLEHGVHLLITQLPDGDLVIGDTHTYGDTLAPFGEERLYTLLLEQARQLLGAELEVRQRWHGIYPTALGHGLPFLVTAPMPGVRVVQNVSGIGMTLSFGQAPLVLDEALATTPA
ncbi:MAG TPA: TIGR03364 family FAD-dependent oxidoreductase [Solirubrobacteraceae bacterium]|nr:TIGR03364 family FAD-dependent oxidoreductase [Solirubrobacteraceae bacterium]